MNLKRFILDLLFPTTCIGCRKPDEPLCAACVNAIPQAEPGCIVCRQRNPLGSICPGKCKRDMPYIDRAVWRAPYDHEIVRELIQRLKYRRRKEYAKVVSHLLLPAARAFLNQNTPKSVSAYEICMLALPLHKKRMRERGFNQAELFAAHLAENLQIRLLPPQTLERCIDTQPQVSLPGRIERQKNIQDAFLVANSSAVKNKIILLVDDVATTGSTLNAAAKALKLTGAKKVWGLVVAKG